MVLMIHKIVILCLFELCMSDQFARVSMLKMLTSFTKRTFFGQPVMFHYHKKYGQTHTHMYLVRLSSPAINISFLVS